ncbi:hypothetical protein B0A49_02768 [Cryomyces minteri]|uniref:Uncharacterized protein n=1 Tax=Cryomyces minteri TaxID=331657 RepID=A0A4U0XM05_9PEZI|nr:hypothetical protein B0A49_02768 [Cryomyces minteri]
MSPTPLSTPTAPPTLVLVLHLPNKKPALAALARRDAWAAAHAAATAKPEPRGRSDSSSPTTNPAAAGSPTTKRPQSASCAPPSPSTSTSSQRSVLIAVLKLPNNKPLLAHLARRDDALDQIARAVDRFYHDAPPDAHSAGDGAMAAWLRRRSVAWAVRAIARVVERAAARDARRQGFGGAEEAEAAAERAELESQRARWAVARARYEAWEAQELEGAGTTA